MVEYSSIVAMSIPKATPFGVSNVPFAVAYLKWCLIVGWPKPVRCHLVQLATCIIPIEALAGQNKSC